MTAPAPSNLSIEQAIQAYNEVHLTIHSLEQVTTRERMISLLRLGQWEQIEPFPDSYHYAYNFMRDLIEWIPCGTEAVNQLLRLWPRHSPLEWARCMTYGEFARQDLVQAFLAKGMLDLNHNILLFSILSPNCLAYRMSVDEQKAIVETLLEAGLDVNEWSGPNRTPYLMHYLSMVVLYRERGDTSMVIETERHARAVLPWLLEKGADPLLEDRQGQNAITLIKEKRRILLSIGEWILEELEKWA